MATAGHDDEDRRRRLDRSRDTSPADMGAAQWRAAVVRALRKTWKDKLTDRAAAMTYYAVLASFPSLIVVVAIVSLVGDPTQVTDTIVGLVRDIAPGTTSAIEQPVHDLATARGGGALLSIGLVTALWAASGYMAALTTALNFVYGVEEGRPFWKLRPLQLVLTLGGVVVAAALGLMLVISGPVTDALGSRLGLGSTVQTVWTFGRWPVLAAVFVLWLAVLYWACPNVEHPRFRWLTIGSAAALVVWVVASLVFGLYASHFGSYNKTFGSLGAVVILLVWLWLTNLAVLLGAAIDVEVERGREIRDGVPEERTLVLPHRDAPAESERAGDAP